MKKSIGFVNWSLLLLLCGSSFLNGCSVVGYHIGDAIDPAYPVEPNHVAADASTLAPNTNVVIQKKDGTELEGDFLGTGQVADTIVVEHYENEFEQWRLRRDPESSGQMPPFGTSVRIRVSVPPREKTYAGWFAGFDPGMIRVYSYSQNRILPLKLEYVEGVDDSLGQVIVRREEIAQVVNGGVPVASHPGFKPGVLLEGKPGIPLYEIESMHHPGGKWVGLAIGIAVDIGVVALVVSKSTIEAGPGGVDWKWGK